MVISLTLRNVARASVVAMMAGADFIKTSTGKEPTKRDSASRLGDELGLSGITRSKRVWPSGFKPAGGIGTAKQSLEWLSMIKEELG